jgi:hypothetical protein
VRRNHLVLDARSGVGGTGSLQHHASVGATLVGYVIVMMGLVLLFEVLPYLEELLRGLRANKGALVPRQSSADRRTEAPSRQRRWGDNGQCEEGNALVQMFARLSYVSRLPAECFRFKRYCPTELQLSLAKWRPRSVTSEAVK